MPFLAERQPFGEQDAGSGSLSVSRLLCEQGKEIESLDAVIVEVPNPLHPFGVKGVGEVPIVPPMPAVAEAVYQSAGVRLRDMPLNPPKIVAALQEQ